MTFFNAADSASGNRVRLYPVGLASGTVRFPATPIVAVGVREDKDHLVGSFELTPEAARLLAEELIKAADAASKEDN